MRSDDSTGKAPQLPAQAWELTAPESYVLRQVGRALPAVVVRFALVELVARGALRLESARVRHGWRPGARTTWLLAEGPAIDDVAEPSLRAALLLYAHLRGRKPQTAVTEAGELEGVTLDELVKAGSRAPSDFAEIRDSTTAAALRKRGLLFRTWRGSAGDRADGLLDEWLRVGRRRFAEWSHDAAWTRDFLAGAGSAALLINEPAAVAARIDHGTGEEIAANLDRAFAGLDLGAAAPRPLGFPDRERRGGGGGGFWSGWDGGGGDGGGGDGGGDGGGGGGGD